MKMGIERALRATFGEALKEVLQVGVVNTAMSSADVDAHLDSLRPAIASYGVNVQVRLPSFPPASPRVTV